MIMISLRYYLEHEAHSETYGLRRDIDTCEIGWLGWCASDDYAWSTTRHYEPQEKSLWRESVQKKGRPEIGGCRLGRSPQRTNTESFFSPLFVHVDTPKYGSMWKSSSGFFKH